MKTRFELLTLAAVLTLTAAATQAGDLIIPNTFVPGTKALAEQVNANFTATQTAVNSKQDKITGACGTGLYVKQVNADGTLVCDNPVGTSGPTSISVHSASFAPNSSTCAYQRTFNNGGFFNSGSNCSVLAGIHIPIGAIITGFSCYITDDSLTTANADMTAFLDRTDLVGGVASIVSISTSTVSTNIGPEVLQGGIFAGNELVPAGSAYSIEVLFGLAGANVDLATATGLELHGCTVSYTR